MKEQVIKIFQFLRAVQSQFLSQFHGFQFSFLKSVKIVMNLFFFHFSQSFSSNFFACPYLSPSIFICLILSSRSTFQFISRSPLSCSYGPLSFLSYISFPILLYGPLLPYVPISFLSYNPFRGVFGGGGYGGSAPPGKVKALIFRGVSAPNGG